MKEMVLQDRSTLKSEQAKLRAFQRAFYQLRVPSKTLANLTPHVYRRGGLPDQNCHRSQRWLSLAAAAQASAALPPRSTGPVTQPRFCCPRGAPSSGVPSTAQSQLCLCSGFYPQQKLYHPEPVKAKEWCGWDQIKKNLPKQKKL